MPQDQNQPMVKVSYKQDTIHQSTKNGIKTKEGFSGISTNHQNVPYSRPEIRTKEGAKSDHQGYRL